jgi:ActR/RegA family two-component response regulator
MVRLTPSILVIDDDDLMLVFFKRMLESGGFECGQAHSVDGSAHARKERSDVPQNRPLKCRMAVVANRYCHA